MQPTPGFLSGKSHGQRRLTATVYGVARIGQVLATKQQQQCILFFLQKEGNLICCDVYETLGHYSKQNKAVTEGQILYDSPI